MIGTGDRASQWASWLGEGPAGDKVCAGEAKKAGGRESNEETGGEGGYPGGSL